MKLFFACLLLVGVVSAARVQFAQWERVPNGFTLQGAAPTTDLLELHIGIKHSPKSSLLEEALWYVSDPASEGYGKHLSHAEVNVLTRPAEASVHAVERWLFQGGVDMSKVNYSPNRDMIEVVVDVETAQKLLQTKYNKYLHEESGVQVTRVHGKYSLPEELVNHVDFVGPTFRFPRVPRSVQALKKRQFGSVTPTFLRKLYNLGDVSASSNKSSVAVTGFLNQFFSPSDLAHFFKSYDKASIGRTMEVVGPNTASNPGVEATLDVQYVMAMAHGVQSTFWSTLGQQPNNPENEPFLKFLFAVSNTTNPPSVFSISYGDNEDTVDYDYAVRVNTEFQKLGARGISILASSGDGGVGGGQPTECTKFIPTFPAGSPYVTAVGGTTGSSPETGASLSSGGFSNYWGRPSYQDSFVKQYLSTASDLPDAERFNATGAGFPDVSAQAEDYAVVYQGFSTPVSGTSCSSPTFSGIVALLNDIRLKAGKSTLGWLNPLFYSNPSAFNDITSGNNPGCGGNGFSAAVGWDPVTGLGSPDYTKLASIVADLK